MPKAGLSDEGVRDGGGRSGDGLTAVLALRLAMTMAIGFGVSASAFNPGNTIPDILDVDTHPWRFLMTPAPGLAFLGLLSALMFPSRHPARIPTGVTAGAALLLIGGLASIPASNNAVLSAQIFVGALVVPAILAVSLVYSDLPRTWLWGAFLFGVTIFLARADAVFLIQDGLPTPAVLFDAKFVQNAFDFHYYSLGNPGNTASFVLIPFGLVLFWALGERRDAVRVALALVLGLLAVTLWMTYSRSALGVAAILIAVAIVVTPAWRWTKGLALGAMAIGALYVAITASGYFLEIFSTAGDQSAQERVLSMKEGLAALSSHPLTGLGLGQFGPEGGYLTAHSSAIQMGAEAGLLGLTGVLLLFGSFFRLSVETVRRVGWTGLQAGAAISLAVYCAYTLVAGGGFNSGLVTVWGMAMAMLVATALGDGSVSGSTYESTSHTP